MIAITGASGLIGNALVPHLTQAGHRVLRLVRRTPGPGEIEWDPAAGRLDPAALTGVDVVIHLAGETISTRWTPDKKRRILESRRQGTTLIARTIAALNPLPLTLISASAVGIYGDRGSELLTEQSAPGTGFAPEVAQLWEASTDPAREAGIRVLNLRFGLVLSADGGVLGKMLPPFKLGLGGTLGHGDQWMSWVSLSDLLGAVNHVMATPDLAGPVNVTAPNPVTNREFTRTLGQVLHRPTPFPVPPFALRMVFGEMADELLLGGTRVIPEKLVQSGYRFQYAELEPALRSVLAA
jgi:uncharacterized protein (TIGR01777 family)